mmetsp:Transcript_34435/g.60386  ORF Transcript_34435/g.60386 Transcript_34435/m.60386 type:complete len:109 (-) Transcript_34435:1980-2306(-)
MEPYPQLAPLEAIPDYLKPAPSPLLGDEGTLNIAESNSFSKSLETLPRILPRKRYKTKARYTKEIPHANTVTTMPDYERRKLLELNELKQGRHNIMRVGAASTFMTFA